MAPAISICSASSIGSPSEEALPTSSPRRCHCENQLAHWDWAGRPHSDLPEECRPRPAIGELKWCRRRPAIEEDGKILVPDQYLKQ
jgi:hypothetical protein